MALRAFALLRAALVASLLFATGACTTAGEVLASSGGSHDASVDGAAASGTSGQDAAEPTSSADDAGADSDTPGCGTLVSGEGGASTGGATSPCEDVESDPLNCGSCGHDCQGAVCVAGSCGPAPKVLGCSQEPAYLAVDTSAVYWLNLIPAMPAGWNGHAQILRCAVGGCGLKPTVLWDGMWPRGSIAAEQGAVWWPTNGPGPGTILSCADDGCANMPTQVFSTADGFQAFTADANHLYWGATGDPTSPLSSCDLPGCTSVQTYASSTGSYTGAIAVSPSAIFWTEAGNNQVWTCPLAGCGSGGPVMLIDLGAYTLGSFAADDQNFYWVFDGVGTPGDPKTGPTTNYANGGVYQCPVSDCSNPTTLATYASWLGGGKLAIDGTNVYWSTADAAGYSGTIVECAIGGCGGSPTSIATTKETYPPGSEGSYAAPGLAVDSAHIYWTDPGRKMVMMAAK
jgi:hypothetical protein